MNRNFFRLASLFFYFYFSHWICRLFPWIFICFSRIFFLRFVRTSGTWTEPRKEKTDVSCSGGGSNGGNNALSPNNDQGCPGALMQGGLNNHHMSTPKLERPNTLGGSTKISRRIICYHGDHGESTVCLFISICETFKFHFCPYSHRIRPWSTG